MAGLTCYPAPLISPAMALSISVYLFDIIDIYIPPCFFLFFMP
jgi:hypothetical protein